MTNDELLKQPIIILGAARSGTTMLCQLLGEHPTLALSVEPRLTWRYGNDRGSDMLRPEQATPAIKQYIRNSFAEFIRKKGKQRLLEKTPSNTLRPEFCKEVFPDAKFIHIIRHGLDSVLSTGKKTDLHAHGLNNLSPGRLKQRLSELQITRMHYYSIEFMRRVSPKLLRPIIGQNVWGPRIPGIQSLAKELHPLEVAAMQWRMCVEASHIAGRSIPKEQFYEFHLEDMSEDKLREVLEFCGLEDNQRVIQHFDQNFKASLASRYSKQVSHEDRQRVLKYIEPTLTWLGYESSDAGLKVQ